MVETKCLEIGDNKCHYMNADGTKQKPISKRWNGTFYSHAECPTQKQHQKDHHM